jgi:hypothetical protein
MLRRALPLLLSTCALVVLSAAPAQAKSCNIDGKQQNLGATYVTSLSAKNTSCRAAEGVVREYHDCRGNRRTCKRKVNGYRCRQTIVSSSPLQYDANVRCKRGAKLVKFAYTQNT